MTQDSWKSIELKSALIVGFWVSKSESDDQGILELWDTSSKENSQLREYVKKNYNQAFRILHQDVRIPTSFVKIGAEAKIKQNYYVDQLSPGPNKMNCCG